MRPFIERLDELETGGIPAGGELLGSDVATVALPAATFVVHRDSGMSSSLVLIDDEAYATVARIGSHALERALERVDRVTREMTHPPLSLPPAWHKYQHDGRVAFFALPRSLNADALRWIAELLPDKNVCFWRLTSRGSEETLHDFVGDYSSIDAVRAAWPQALESAQRAIPPVTDSIQSLQPAVDLQIVGSEAVSRKRTYSSWLPLLTPTQTEVLGYAGTDALRVRGPAGTGKTLVLQLKALHEIYAAADHEEALPHILYLTHSWSLAELVDSALYAIDERGLASGPLDVMPLTWLRESLYGELPEGVEVLGEDSLEGKRRQLSLISEIINEIASNDWPTYQSRASELVVAGVESTAGSPERVLLCWDLMREFAEVIDANQLKPGLNSLRKYVDLPREAWMVHLPTRADLEFVFAVYRRYVTRLVEEGQLTTDQALDDFRKYLESYTWNLRRQTDGYDLVLVDEFHLFNDTERYLVHLLTRDPERPPRLILALDPYQSAFALLTGLTEGSLSRAASENLGRISSSRLLDLTTIHRFTRPIHELVKLIHGSFPNLVELGEDWVFDFSKTNTADSSGDTPQIYIVGSVGEAAQTAIAVAEERNERTPNDERVAVIAAGVDELEALQASLAESGRGSHHFTVMESRDDVELLNYSRKSVVVGAAEFCAGLQFAHVVALAFSRGEVGRSAGTSAERASLSELYLAVTRGERSLTLVTCGGDGQVHAIAQKAIDQGIAQAGVT